MQPLNFDQYAQGLMILCAGHRSRYGIKQPPKRNDCELKPCRTGCPIQIMNEKLGINQEGREEDRE